MVTTRSQSVSPRKRSVPAQYADRESSPTPVSPRKRTVSARATASPTKSKAPRRKSTAPMIVKDEIVVKSEDEDGGEYMNGHAVEKRPKSPRKVSSRAASGEVKGKGKASHKVDNSGHFEFGGTPGTLAMMTLFPILMYYLWVCSTFYGGSVMVKKASETWLAFADRMVAHILKVQ
jgi:Delta24(24(1))-sterol reductase